MLFISSKKLFTFSRYLNFCNSVFPFFSCRPMLQRMSKDKLKVYDVINFLNKNLVIYFVWFLEKEKRYDIETLSIDRVSKKEQFYSKILWQEKKSYAKCAPKVNPMPLFKFWLNKTKQPLHAKNKIFWKRIIRKPYKS